MDLSQLRKKTDVLLSDHRHACRQAGTERAALERARRDVAAATEAQQRLQQLAEDVQTRAHSQIAGVITRCLSAVFAEPYTFSISFVQRRGKTEADLKFLRAGNEVDPMDASGGGCVDLCSFAGRLACLMLAKPQRRRLIVADEPFKMLSAEYVPAARELIETLAEEMGFQMILVTHEPNLACGRIIEFPSVLRQSCRFKW